MVTFSKSSFSKAKVKVFQLQQQLKPTGWYWQVCKLNHLPDEEAYGPFDSQEAALEDSRQTLEE